ncbi:hypothetical protein ACFE04_011046 [Oxalis oulophora]
MEEYNNKKKRLAINNDYDRKAGYDLRGSNRRKTTWRVSDNSSEECYDKFCKQCGKGFRSCKALFGHMKCHSSKINKNNLILQKQDKVRNDRKSVQSNNSIMNSCSLSEIEQEQEEIALCLMMLSRDKVNFSSAESSENDNSVFVATRIEIESSFKPVKHKKVSDFDKFVQSDHVEYSEVEFAKENELEQVQSDVKNHNSSSIKREFRDKSQSDFNKRCKFECHTCNKQFHSYQALGGHMTSHNKKKIKSRYPIIDSSETTIETGNLVDFGKSDYNCKRNSFPKGHECSICFKVFPSGQALGGHKRLHLVATPSNQIMDMEKSEVREFFDLNLPAPVEEEYSTNQGELQPWWLGSSDESLIGLISN